MAEEPYVPRLFVSLSCISPPSQVSFLQAILPVTPVTPAILENPFNPVTLVTPVTVVNSLTHHSCLPLTVVIFLLLFNLR